MRADMNYNNPNKIKLRYPDKLKSSDFISLKQGFLQYFVTLTMFFAV